MAPSPERPHYGAKDAGDSLHRETVIVGAGLAGLFLALKLAPMKVSVLSPAPLGRAAASAWAQGGLAAALSPEDSPQAHMADTIAVGGGLVDPVAARILTEEGPARIRDLLALGVAFDRSADGSLRLSLEAAHSFPRVARVGGDLVGRAIMDALTTAVRAAPHIEILEGVRAIALLEDNRGGVSGISVVREDGGLVRLHADQTVLAMGGAGGLFRLTTNPREARGEGFAMAFKAGALIADPEFVQFHPTAMDVDTDPAPLATEALRGEGAVLVDEAGRAFMARYDRRADLAPRDVVARAIGAELAAGRRVFLDGRTAIGDHFPAEFPVVFEAAMKAGCDPRVAPIPVAPAAHYHMGGIVTDLQGKTSLEGLWACGECAATGAHGANRLASNSLLEAVVFAERIARALQATQRRAVPSNDFAPVSLLTDADLPPLRAAMTAHAGVVRDARGLARARDLVAEMSERFPGALAPEAARLILDAALAREESRGAHFRADFPEALPDARHSFRVRTTPRPPAPIKA